MGKILCKLSLVYIDMKYAIPLIVYYITPFYQVNLFVFMDIFNQIPMEKTCKRTTV